MKTSVGEVGGWYAKCFTYQTQPHLGMRLGCVGIVTKTMCRPLFFILSSPPAFSYFLCLHSFHLSSALFLFPVWSNLAENPLSLGAMHILCHTGGRVCVCVCSWGRSKYFPKFRKFFWMVILTIMKSSQKWHALVW